MSLKDTQGWQQWKTLSTAKVFAVLWLLTFALYFPAAKAGFVTDFTGWLDQVRNHGFWEFINRSNFQARSLYQFTQLATYLIYKSIGITPWLWHLLFVTLHVANATLIFRLCSRLLDDTNVKHSKTIAFSGVILFCVSPYISETVVWEPSFHFLQGLMIILFILICVQQFIHKGAIRYAWIAGILYFLSVFTLEAFYMTPWLVLSAGLFYRYNNKFDPKIFNRVLKLFFLPLIILFLSRLVLFRVLYGGWVSRIGTETVTSVRLDSFGKPAKYLYHLLFLGRFFTFETRQKVYGFCDSATGVLIFWGIIALFGGLIISQFSRMDGKGKVASLLFSWTLITLALLIPLWFSNMLLVTFDRYTYFAAPFFYMVLAVLAGYISSEFIRICAIGLFALINLRYAIQVSRYWGKSARVIHGLLYNLPDAGNKTILLLNLPECLNGVPMIGSEKESEFKLMHNLLLPSKQITNNVYDVLSYNMLTPNDGAHAVVVNDSTVRVTLNQWGTWWWYEGKGAYGYENPEFKQILVDGGHFYDLILRKPADTYLLLYQVGDHWKVVDWNKKGAEQD